jgi:hypothetical protein
MKDHTRIEELYVARSLGELESGDAEELARSVAAHGSDCPECRSFRDDYEEVAGRLAFALSPERVPEGMVDRILEDRPARKAKSPRFRRVAAALAAAVLLGVGAVGGYLLAPEAVPGLDQAAEYLSEPGVKLASLEGTGQGNLAMAFHHGRQDSYLIGSGLAPAPKGDVYELWLMSGNEFRPAGVFEPEGDVVVVPVTSDLSGVTLAAVTIERAPGAESPTTDPIFSAPITF